MTPFSNVRAARCSACSGITTARRKAPSRSGSVTAGSSRGLSWTCRSWLGRCACRCWPGCGAAGVGGCGGIDTVEVTGIVCVGDGSFHRRTVRVVLVRDNKPRTHDRDERGYGLPLVTTDLTSTAEDLVTRYASRWCIEVAFSDARQILGVGQARNRTCIAVHRTVPFGLVCLSLVNPWYAAAGHAPADVAERRERSRWYTTKTEP